MGGCFSFFGCDKDGRNSNMLRFFVFLKNARIFGPYNCYDVTIRLHEKNVIVEPILNETLFF